MTFLHYLFYVIVLLMCLFCRLPVQALQIEEVSILSLKTPLTLPAGYAFNVRLQHPLSSRLNRVGDPVLATLVAPFTIDHTVIAPVGSKLTGVVEAVYPPTWRPRNHGYIQVRFDMLEPKLARFRLPLNAIINATDNTKGRVFGHLSVSHLKEGTHADFQKGAILLLILEKPFTWRGNFIQPRYSISE